MPSRLPAAPALLGLALFLTCAKPTQVFRLEAPEGVRRYEIICEKHIRRCRARAEQVCASPYQVLESTGSLHRPKRATSEPGPRSVGPRYQHETWHGSLVVECGAERTVGEAEQQARPQSPAPQSPAVSTPLPDGMLCIPGSTQACLGAGACRGAQACARDGRGFSPCDCGRKEPAQAAEAPVPAAVPTPRVAP